ncbi:MAG: HD family phosphohydrolase [Thermogutta sp.]
MFFGGTKRKRSERLAGLVKVPGKWDVAWSRLHRTEVALRFGISLAFATVLCMLVQAWNPPPLFRSDPELVLDSRVGLPAGTLEQHRPLLVENTVQSKGADDTHTVRSWGRRLLRFAAMWLMVVFWFAVGGAYIFLRERRVLVGLNRLFTLLTLLIVAIIVARWLAQDFPYTEIIPLMIFAQTLAVAYHREFALILGIIVLVLYLLVTGQEVGTGILWASVLTAAILQLDSVRTRTKLLTVSAVAAVVGVLLRFLLALGNEVPLNMTLVGELWRIVLACVVTGFLMHGLLPFIERFFGVLTDMSLLELSDLSHPLLRELARRAPSTYNHSINVGAIAEAAADSIGARGLLVRVGAYFHDIGKMLKPNYFIENQGESQNRHESLEPTISSLIIIAHVKDGADLARQHHLPEPIIDFIEQHHGTTLVEYFFERAKGKQETQAETSKVDENNFRYPGPAPQTKEAAVLMLADAVESAVRSLKDPAPSRIEAVVRDIAERKLHEGQFDETNLTLRELRTIEDSLIRSLVAMYHGRIKYPERRTEDRREGERRTEHSVSSEACGLKVGSQPENGRSVSPSEKTPTSESQNVIPAGKPSPPAGL